MLFRSRAHIHLSFLGEELLLSTSPLLTILP